MRSTAGGDLGGRFVWGHSYEPTTGLLKDISDNGDQLLYWGSNPETGSRYSSTGQANTLINRGGENWECSRCSLPPT